MYRLRYVALCVLLGAGTAAEPLVVTLRSEVTLAQSRVKLGDVASLEGGGESQRQRAAALDVADLPVSGEPVVVSREQISFRLQLAGLDGGRFRVEGARVAYASLARQERLENQIEEAARQALVRKLPGKGEDFVFRLAQPIRLPALNAGRDDIHLETSLPDNPAIPGRVCVQVGIYVRGAHRLSLMVCLDVRALQPVAVAVRRIEAGEMLTEDNVRQERYPVERVNGAGPRAADLHGKRARRPLAPGHVLRADDVEAAPAGAATPSVPVVIHSRDTVLLVVHIGPLDVKAQGVALEDGRPGQSIRVRNTDSNTVITGRVADRGIVEVGASAEDSRGPAGVSAPPAP